MKKKDVIAYFGSQQKTADALVMTQASVSRWGDDIPRLRAFEIERITNGELKVDLTPNYDLEIQSEKLSCTHQCQSVS